jgi:hypothetical protein
MVNCEGLKSLRCTPLLRHHHVASRSLSSASSEFRATWGGCVVVLQLPAPAYRQHFESPFLHVILSVHGLNREATPTLQHKANLSRIKLYAQVM